MTEVVVSAGGDVVVETLNDVLVVLTLDEPNVITTPAEQGPPGPQGPVGPAGSVYMTYIAGITLSGHKAVQIDGTGAAVYVDSGTVADAGRVLGITINAALLGAAVGVQATGEIDEVSWSWVPGQPVYVGANGSLTQTPPATGFIQAVGMAVAPTKLVVGIRPAIIL